MLYCKMPKPACHPRGTPVQGWLSPVQGLGHHLCRAKCPCTGPCHLNWPNRKSQPQIRAATVKIFLAQPCNHLDPPVQGWFAPAQGSEVPLHRAELPLCRSWCFPLHRSEYPLCRAFSSLLHLALNLSYVLTRTRPALRPFCILLN